MSEARTGPDAETLARESAWLTRLARRLVNDPGRVDDAVQDTLVSAWARGGDAPPRSWLARVLRNHLRQAGRGEARRRAREEAVARAERLGPARSALERLELQARVVAAVQALDEPYRTTLVLRFLDDRPVRAVARTLGVPVKTVQTRLERGLAKLRARLDEVWRDEQGGAGWRAVLFALPGVAAPTTAILTGALTMGTLSKLGGAAAAVALVAGTAWMLGAGGGEPAHPSGVALREPGPVAPVPEPAEEVSPATSSPVRIARAAAAAEPAPVESPAPAGWFEGRVVDVADQPVEGVRIASILPHGEPASSDAAGAFRLALPEGLAGPRLVHGDDAAWVDLARPTTDAEAPRLVVAPAFDLEGTVTDSEGAPLAGAEVRFEVPLAASLALQGDDRHVPNHTVSTDTDAEGRFTFERLPQQEGVLVEASLSGYVTERHELELPPVGSVVFRLEHGDIGLRTLTGRVVDASGDPVADALVSAPAGAVTTDRAGAFAVELPEPEDEAGALYDLRAVAPGHLPAHRRLDLTQPLPSHVELQLGGAPLSIAGRAVDRAGDPIPGALVWTSGLTAFGKVVRKSGGMRFLMRLSVEELLDGDPTGASGVRTHTDAEGRFELEGLLPREYALYVLDERDLATAAVEGVRAGARGLELVVVPEVAPVAVAGRVVQLSGEPLSGVHVQPESPAHLVNALPRATSSVETDEDGRFRFEALVPAGLRLRVWGPEVARDAVVTVEEGDDLGGLELRVPRLAQLRVRCTEPDLADATVTVLDGDDQPLTLLQEMGGAHFVCQSFALVDGLTGVLSTDERATALLVRAAGREPIRIPLRMVPGRVVEVSVP